MCIEFILSYTSHLGAMLNRICLLSDQALSICRVDKTETHHLEPFFFCHLYLEMRMGSTKMRNITSNPRSQLQLEP